MAGARRFSGAFDRCLDGLANLLISRAATEAAGQSLLDLFPRGVWVFVEQRLGGDEESRRAVPALRGSQIGECLLKRMQLMVAGQTFDRRDRSALAVEAEDETGEHGL